MSSSDCAFTCLEYLYTYYWNRPFMRMKWLNEFDSMKDGVTLASLVIFFKQEGIDVKAYRTQQIESLRYLPCILLFQFPNQPIGHYVILKKVQAKYVVVFDPYLGKTVKVAMKKLMKVWQGVYLDFNQNLPLIKKPNEKYKHIPKFQSKLQSFLSTFEWGLQGLSFLIILEVMNQSLHPVMLLWLFLLQGILWFIHFFELKTFQQSFTKVNEYVNNTGFQRLFHLPQTIWKHIKKSEVYLMFLDVFTYRGALLSNQTNLTWYLIIFFIGESILLSLSLPVGVASLLYNLFMLALQHILVVITLPFMQKIKQCEAVIHTKINQFVEHLDLIQINHFEAFLSKKFTKDFYQLNEYEKHLQKVDKYTLCFKNVLQLAMMVLFLWEKDHPSFFFLFFIHYVLTYLLASMLEQRKKQKEYSPLFEKMEQLRQVPLLHSVAQNDELLQNIKCPWYPQIELRGIHYLESDSKETIVEVYHFLLQEQDTFLGRIYYVTNEFLEIEGTLQENLMMQETNEMALHQILSDLGILTYFPRWKLEKTMPFPLSGEEQQIINVIRAMIAQPDILLIEDGMEAIRPTLQRILLLALIEQFSSRILLLSGEKIRNLAKNIEIDTIFLNQLAKSV